MIRLRKATASDLEFLFQLANDRDVRQMAFAQDKIQHEEHCWWFDQKLSDIDCLMYIAYKSNGEEVGQVRLDLERGSFLVDISVVNKHRGKGIATKMLQAVCNKPSLKGCRLVAEVKPENMASRKLFERCGFRLENSTNQIMRYEKNA